MIFLTTFNEKSLVMSRKTVTFEVGTAGADSPWSSKGVNTKKDGATNRSLRHVKQLKTNKL
jgi:hypothetical protein